MREPTFEVPRASAQDPPAVPSHPQRLGEELAFQRAAKRRRERALPAVASQAGLAGAWPVAPHPRAQWPQPALHRRLPHPGAAVPEPLMPRLPSDDA